MVNKCCVPGCRSNYKSIKKGVLFESCTVFSFPKNESHRKEWIRRIPRDLTITKNTVVCIKHFHEEDIIRFKIPRTKTGPSAKVCFFNNNMYFYIYDINI